MTCLLSPMRIVAIRQEQAEPDLQPRSSQMMQFVANHLSRLQHDDSGQGLVEYLLILALVAFAATAGMTTLASGLNSAFSKIGDVLGSYIK
jgi:pilus assembly protein Flp/PilA